MRYRILVTGSRDWDNWEEVYRQLTQLCEENGFMYEPDENGNTLPNDDHFTVVHGHCPTGADHWADSWCIENGFEAERHPANWVEYGKRAGFVRNEEMVESGADVCIAFIRNGSKGASMTARLADEYGIPVQIVRQDDGEPIQLDES